MARTQVADEVRRDLHADIGMAFADFARELLDVLHFADNAKCFGVNEAIEELPAFDGAIFVQDRHPHVFDVVVERVTERDHLDERRKKHEKKRHRIAQDDDEFLEEYCAETPKRFRFHQAASRWFSGECFALSATKTSSSEGPIT